MKMQAGTRVDRLESALLENLSSQCVFFTARFNQGAFEDTSDKRQCLPAQDAAGKAGSRGLFLVWIADCNGGTAA